MCNNKLQRNAEDKNTWNTYFWLVCGKSIVKTISKFKFPNDIPVLPRLLQIQHYVFLYNITLGDFRSIKNNENIFCKKKKKITINTSTESCGKSSCIMFVQVISTLRRTAGTTFLDGMYNMLLYIYLLYYDNGLMLHAFILLVQM